jgi:hypothetical protein
MAAIHVDETSGSDITGTGTPDQPYQTLGFAVFSHGGGEPFLTRKDSSGTYEEPTQSSLKKAKKTAEGIEKKRKKQEELAEREAKEKGEERERREKLLEESKKLVLVEDPALPRATKVRGCSFYITLTGNEGGNSRRSYVLHNYDLNESGCSDGYIVCVSRKISSFWLSETAQDTSRQCFLAKSSVLFSD